jgi:hypothetical protein
MSNQIKDILNKEVFLQEAIGRGIVSYNKLADYIKPELEKKVGKKVKHSTISMAIRRYAEKLEKKQNTISFNYFSETLVKTDICYIIVEESSTALPQIQSIYNKMDLRHGTIFNIVHANYEIGIITNQSMKEKIINELNSQRIKRVVDDLVVISLTYSKDYLKTPGVIYNVSRFLAWENINVYSIWLTTQEFNILISHDDTVRTFSILNKLVKTNR